MSQVRTIHTPANGDVQTVDNDCYISPIDRIEERVKHNADRVRTTLKMAEEIGAEAQVRTAISFKVKFNS